MYQPARRNIVREHIIAVEVMKLERRQARARAGDPKAQLTGVRDRRAERAERGT
jgi:hypothetical protein